MSEFMDKYFKLRGEKDSKLCIALDPTIEKMKDDHILDFCLDIIERTSEYTLAYKPNSQFMLFYLDLKQLKKLNDKIHDSGCVSILDHKLSDIGSSNESAIYWIKEADFDAFTFSPFAGNIREATEQAHRKNLGIFILTLMSNPEAQWIQKGTWIGENLLYLEVAKRSNNFGADGLVVGTTGHVTGEDIREIREIAENAVFLCPGVGAQGGDIGKILRNAGGNVLINVGRSIIYDKNPAERAKEYCETINSIE